MEVSFHECRPNKQTYERQLEAAKRLWKIALKDAEQGEVVARFLLGLYNGPAYPFDLTDLRTLNREVFIDCISVLDMDYWRVMEIHRHLGMLNGEFDDLAQTWNLTD